VGSIIPISGEPLRLRISGNYLDFMPDGVTPYDVTTDPTLGYLFQAFAGYRMEFGRYGEIFASSPTDGQPMVYGTDGDGVNDADEGNLFGPMGGLPGLAGTGTYYPALISYYRSGSNVFLIAGNRWGIGNNGTIWPNSAFFISHIYLDNVSDGNTKFFIGSDFATNRSAATIAAQANHIYNNLPISMFGDPPSTTYGIVPFFNMERPRMGGTNGPPSTNATLSLRGNVMAGNGISPFNYVTGTGVFLKGLTNFYSPYLDTNVAVIPMLSTNSSVANLSGTFAPGVGYFTNVIIDVYQLDPYGWTNGQKFGFSELIVGGVTNGFPQGKKYLGSYQVPNTGSFSISLPPGTDWGDGRITVTANYSVSPAGTPLARTFTSVFSMPVTVRPGIVASKSGNNVNLTWEPSGVQYTVQTNASLTSGSWGNYTVGKVSPPVVVPVGNGTLFFRLKN